LIYYYSRRNELQTEQSSILRFEFSG